MAPFVDNEGIGGGGGLRMVRGPSMRALGFNRSWADTARSCCRIGFDYSRGKRHQRVQPASGNVDGVLSIGNGFYGDEMMMGWEWDEGEEGWWRRWRRRIMVSRSRNCIAKPKAHVRITWIISIANRSPTRSAVQHHVT